MFPRHLTLRRAPGDDPAPLLEREWLVTNGLGGFASATVLGLPGRRYHGVFVPNLSDPPGRHVLIPRVDELIEVGDRLVNLGGAEHVDGRIDCDAHRHLREFRLDALTPVWRYEIAGRLIEKSILMPHGRNAVLLRYRLISGSPCRLGLRVFVAARRADSLPDPGDAAPFELLEGAGSERLLRVDGIAPLLRLQASVGCRFVAEPGVDRDVLFRIDRDRGYDHVENQFSVGRFEFALDADAPASLVATTDAGRMDEERGDADVAGDAIERRERERLAALLSASGVDAGDDFARHLVLAADQFIVLPGSRRDESSAALAHDDELRSVMAGYHWFNDWGRDTMISLEGLTLATGRHAEARAILRTFAHYIRDGLLPNLFPEGRREALYHTADATLWYFHALDRYLEHRPDEALLRELFPALASVVDHHLQGTRFGIGVDSVDCLVRAAADGYQLTWMDAKVDDWVVTPRRGKPVEIQALWYNALRRMASWSETLAAADPRYAELAARVHASFNARFWSAELGHLFDVVDGPDGDDSSLRPNQVLAMSLRHPVLEPRHRAPVLRAIERELLTPVGLRTLDAAHARYQRAYEGPLLARDAAYHQGTVWPWLIGHYVDATIREHGDPPRARKLLQAFPQHLLEAGIGSIGEVFDAEPPHRPRGCIAQAWSVAEVLRAWLATRGG